MKKLYSYFGPLMIALTPYLALAQNANDNSAVPSYPESYPRGFMRNMMDGGYPYYGGHMFLWLILVILFWVLVVGLIIYLIKYLVAGGYRHHRYHGEYYDKPRMKEGWNDSVAIIKKRYAKGEIDRKEYRELMDELTKK